MSVTTYIDTDRYGDSAYYLPFSLYSPEGSLIPYLSFLSTCVLSFWTGIHPTKIVLVSFLSLPFPFSLSTLFFS
ncbi:hypothetical protein K435DRAFT_781277 [Dendrothele bispora CBS 962.96]|uniref:Uncharacterized protein n=1 Tax=Dendrothele bispora (strain CBS 962.96) TaxID=1314807 RepID=A0A4S8LMN8_DENBC|nr:hypothetical protein K435DRAFT_781277 [Dendrothele bispora CBS 962.96]